MRFKPGQRIICTAPTISTSNAFYRGYVHKILRITPDNSLETVIVKLLAQDCNPDGLGMLFVLNPVHNKQSYDSAQLYSAFIFTKANKC